MKPFNTYQPILGVIAAGLILGAIILSGSGAGNSAGIAAERKPAEAQEQHDDGNRVAMTDEQIRTAGIALATAGPASIGTTVEFPGEVKFNDDRTAHVVPRLPGVAEAVHADLGQKVKKGQVLAIISSPELADLRSAMLAAQKRLALAQLTYEREKKLWQDRISAEQDYLQARQAFHEAEIQADSARSKLAALGAHTTDGALNRYVLRAPFDGVVVEKHIALGEAVKEDANVFLLSDLATVWVEVNVPARDIELVRVGEPVTIQSASTASATAGKISYVGSLLGEQTRTAKARVVIDNPNMAWRPGLFVNVAMAQGQKQAPVAVPSEAVHTVDGKSVVFIRTAGGFQAQPVRTGITDSRMVDIPEGLAPGVSVAAAGSFVVKAQQAKGSAAHDH
ncbi:efflux RND transporter periplasmic adaptor subunit [Duganella sp. FT92W]|uniref:Efflux RND transporter periplasmic adaptor subunit n=1 Tax=Pseudoduganella rivuli TaxID=2666085 RepID=A0A7X2ISA1_9BURK|nr:efflux RND transporter periplasmic adaptor subunit [Pseudoduganella rivuli]MRV75146.1 efflux RND transporter periplasmic adaptor subunit [Pseudoduganella rivuli]